MSSDNENKLGAFVRSITTLSKLGIGAKAVTKNEGLLHLENSILKQIVLLVTGQLDLRRGVVSREKFLGTLSRCQLASCEPREGEISTWRSQPS